MKNENENIIGDRKKRENEGKNTTNETERNPEWKNKKSNEKRKKEVRKWRKKLN